MDVPKIKPLAQYLINSRRSNYIAFCLGRFCHNRDVIKAMLDLKVKQRKSD